MSHIIKIVYIVALAQLIPVFCQAQDSQSLVSEEKYKYLREFMYENLQANFLDTSQNKYSSYLCEVKLGTVVTVLFPENTPPFVSEKRGQLEEKLGRFLEQKGLTFENEVIVIYPVVQIWKDKKSRTNNLGEVLESLFGEGINFSGEYEKVRIESPIVISVLDVKS